jgi:hypothetical protein
LECERTSNPVARDIFLHGLSTRGEYFAEEKWYHPLSYQIYLQQPEISACLPSHKTSLDETGHDLKIPFKKLILFKTFFT